MLALGCSDAAPAFLDVSVVSPSGTTPFADASYETFEVEILQEGFEPTRVTLPIDGGRFDEAVQFLSVSAATRITLNLTGPSARVRGVTPSFAPGQVAQLRLLVGEPGTCATIEDYALPSARSGLAVSEANGFVLVAGGSGDLTGELGLLDRLTVRSSTLPERAPVAPLGDTRAAPLGEGRVLVLPAETEPFVFDLGTETDRVQAVVAHTGAGGGSVIALPDGSTMIVGGDAEGALGATWTRVSVSVDPDDANEVVLVSTQGTLAAERLRPALAVFGDLLYVFGGQPVGEPFVERLAWADAAPAGEAVDAGGLAPAGDSQDGAVFVGSSAMLFVDRGGATPDTWRLTGCPAACALEPGPAWDNARAGAEVHGDLIVGGEGSTRIERVRPDEAQPFSPAFTLQRARAAAGVLATDDGGVLVAGGESAGTRRADVERCFPPL